ncbi:MAG TPA: 6-O-methylguanine DNA methyltransferase [Pseudohongiella sp.]|nr:6-O-methylguanine DNA methyltransferase [Pseudohongiella sp.]HBX38160.1 6-O-methylguanine DNA methyltransferase [Pseudohongiella sp.]
MSDYDRIARAMTYIVEHATDQPSLETVAAHVNLSPYHFQRQFSRLAGISPKRFLQTVTLERGKYLLRQRRSLLDVSLDLGLSGSSRLHDHFVQLEAVTPGEFRSGGEQLCIRYGVHDSPLGQLFVAATPRGVCRMAFVDHEPESQLLSRLQKDWPKSAIIEDVTATQHVIESFFRQAPAPSNLPLSLHVSGTNFQLAVWRALLNIPYGELASYGQLAASIGAPKSARSVGSAIGANPVALLIPCHRVIQQSGALGGYRWGESRKAVVQAWEIVQNLQEADTVTT